MAIRIDTTKELVVDALEVKIASVKRASNSAKQPEFKELYAKQLQELQKALGSIADAK